MKTRLLTLFAAIMCAVSVMAYDFEAGGIYYNITSTTAPYMVEVTNYGTNTYSGDIVIPSTVVFCNVVYDVTRIGKLAFKGCNSLSGVIIANSVTSIGEYAFSNCSSLTSVIIPSSVTNIGGCALFGCSSLTNVTLPNSVTSIGERIFDNCNGLISINVDTANPNYSSADGVLFNKDQTTLIQCPMGKMGVYSMPNTVAHIGCYAFNKCSGLTCITIPNSVTVIEERAFGECKGLINIELPNSVITIGNCAFSQCDGLLNVTLPNSITTIGMYAFNQCGNLESVSIGNSVTNIERTAFGGCKSLKNIDVNTENPSYSSVNGVLFNKDKTTLIQYPRGRTETTYIVPNSVTCIGHQAFSACVGLTSVTLSNFVTIIETGAFLDCENLRNINIPNSVREIGGMAFAACDLTSVTIPGSVTSIGVQAFGENKGLTDINVDASNPNYSSVNGILFNKDLTILYCFPLGKTETSYAIPNSVVSIGDYAFYSCTGLTSITIPPDFVTQKNVKNYCTDNQ